MQPFMQPKFFAFMQCTFGDAQWQSISISTLPGEQQWVMEHMSRFRSRSDGARVHILDMSYKEIKLKFKASAIVGVGNGMFYCDSMDVTETEVSDAPPEYASQSPIDIS